jgi:short-subunit dehydrogenase
VLVRDAHVLITGASRGIGEALARECAAQGARVTVVARSEAPLRAVASDIGALAVPLDLADPDAVDGLIARVEHDRGPVDLLISNAAIAHVAEFIRAPREDIAQHVNINLLAPMLLCHQVLPLMLERGHGGIITISSLSSEISVRNLSSYTATKAGVTSFMLNLQRELRRAPIRTLLVILGEVETQMVEQGRTDPVLEAIADRLGRLGSMSSERVARDTLRAYEAGRSNLVLPRAAWPLFALRQLPNRLSDLAMRGIA